MQTACSRNVSLPKSLMYFMRMRFYRIWTSKTSCHLSQGKKVIQNAMNHRGKAIENVSSHMDKATQNAFSKRGRTTWNARKTKHNFINKRGKATQNAISNKGKSAPNIISIRGKPTNILSMPGEKEHGMPSVKRVKLQRTPTEVNLHIPMSSITGVNSHSINQGGKVTQNAMSHQFKVTRTTTRHWCKALWKNINHKVSQAHCY